MFLKGPRYSGLRLFKTLNPKSLLPGGELFKTLNPKSLLPRGEGTLKTFDFTPLSLWERGRR